MAAGSGAGSREPDCLGQGTPGGAMSGAAIGAVGGYPRGIPFFWQIKMWETHGSYRKIVEKT